MSVPFIRRHSVSSRILYLWSSSATVKVEKIHVPTAWWLESRFARTFSLFRVMRETRRSRKIEEELVLRESLVLIPVEGYTSSGFSQADSDAREPLGQRTWADGWRGSKEMADPSMEFPKPIDFDEERSPRRPRVTLERMLVLGLLLTGGLFLGLAAEFWPSEGWPAANPFRQVNLNDAEEIKAAILRQLQEGDIDQALLLSDKLIEVDAKSGYFERARIRMLIRDTDKAIEDLNKLIELDGKNGDAYRLRSLCQIQKEDYEKAVADAGKLAEIEPRDGNLLLGQILREKKDYPKAIEALNKAIAADPAFADSYVQRYHLHFSTDKFDQALVDAEKLTELRPPQGYILKGDALARLGKSDEAVESYDKALGHDPTNAMALNNKAYHLATVRKNLDEAAKDVAEAIEIAGEEPAYVDTRGFIHYLQGKYKAALADFNKSLKTAEDAGPEFTAEIYFHRGLVYRKLDETELAEQDFQKAKEGGFAWKELPEPVATP
jgi:tetratricopeptide (TPR) repeat protein